MSDDDEDVIPDNDDGEKLQNKLHQDYDEDYFISITLAMFDTDIKENILEDDDEILPSTSRNKVSGIHRELDHWYNFTNQIHSMIGKIAEEKQHSKKSNRVISHNI
jgi:hypothetical protein